MSLSSTLFCPLANWFGVLPWAPFRHSNLTVSIPLTYPYSACLLFCLKQPDFCLYLPNFGVFRSTFSNPPAIIRSLPFIKIWRFFRPPLIWHLRVIFQTFFQGILKSDQKSKTRLDMIEEIISAINIAALLLGLLIFQLIR